MTLPTCKVFSVFSIAILLLAATNSNANSNNNSATQNRQIQVRLEVRGTVVSTIVEDKADSKEEEPQPSKRVPLEVKADFQFEELVQNSGDVLRAIRFYEKAHADIRLNNLQEKSNLDASNQYILVNRNAKKTGLERIAVASLAGTLSQREWQLIETPASSFLIDQIIAGRKLQKGESWKIEGALLADLLLLDSIDESNVVCNVVNRSGNRVEVSMHGHSKGGDDDVNADVRVSGKFIFDAKTRTFLKSELTLRHKRDEGQIGPGYDALIKVESTAKAVSNSSHLSKSNISKIRSSRSITSDLQLENPTKTIALVHSRHWRSVINSNELTVLRLLDDGQVLGQCNVIPMPSLPDARVYTADVFAEDVKKSLGTSAKIVDRRSDKAINGNSIYEIEVTSVEDGVQLTRVYYHVIHPQGFRAMCIVTTEAELADAIREYENKLVHSMVLRSPEQATELRKRAATASRLGTNQRK